MSLVSVVVLLMLYSETWPVSSLRDNGTILAIPVLLSDRITPRNCTALFNSEMNGLVVSYQSHFATMDQSTLHLHTAPCSLCGSCMHDTIPINVAQHFREVDFNECYDQQDDCPSWRAMCENKVTAISFQNLDDQSFAAVYTSLNQNLQYCLAVYPTPLLPPQGSPSLYTYHIVHGRLNRTTLKGLTVYNPYDEEGKISINFSSPAIGWDGTVVDRTGSEVIIKCRGVLWIQPAFNETLNLSLSGTTLTSTLPLNVFTNWAASDRNSSGYSGLWHSDFEYDSHLLHQMPERAHWGRRFVIDTRYSGLLHSAVQSLVMYEITIVSYTSDNIISLKSMNPFEDIELKEPTAALSEEHFEYRLTFSPTEMLRRAYLEISSVFAVVVLSEAFLNSTNDYKPVYYSTLVQPVEWHANRQIVVLAHPLANATYRYRISVTVPSGKSDPDQIVEADAASYCQGNPLSSYPVSTHAVGSAYSLLVYSRTIANSNQTQTRLLLRHLDVHTAIGVTVHAFSDNLHYSYSNGYTLSDGVTNRSDSCSSPVPPTTISNTSISIHVTVSISLVTMVMLAVTITVFTSAAFIMWRRRRRRKKLSSITPGSLFQQPNGEYPYDIFILCADKDESFVRECIEIPLEECGYRALRKNTAPDGLFTPGNTIVSDIDCVVKLCSRVIVVCSENYYSTVEGARRSCPNSRVEIDCCKEMVASRNDRVIPIILDGVEDTDFSGFTQHRVASHELTSDSKARHDFVRRLKRDMNIKKCFV